MSDAAVEPIELRYMEWSDIEIGAEQRADEAAEARTIKGYAAKFEKLSLDLGGYREVISKGAFLKSLKRDIVALWSHNTDIVLGRSSNGTLELEEDEVGLRFKLALDSDHWSDYAFRKIQRKDVRGMSFGFRIPNNGFEWLLDDAKKRLRRLVEIDLHEVSPTVFPAYPSSSVAVRSAEDVLRSAPPIEALAARSVSLERQRLRLIEAC